MLRPKITKKQKPKGSSPGCRLLAMLILILPLALAITAWVTRDQWLKMVAPSFIKGMQEKVGKPLNMKDRERVKAAAEILSDRISAGRISIEELAPVKDRYDKAQDDGRINEAEALDILNLAETFARKPAPLPKDGGE